METVNPDMLLARKNCTLKLDEITEQFHNGKQQNDTRKFIEKIVYGDEEFQALPKYDFLSNSEKYSLMVRKSKILVRLLKKHFNNEYSHATIALLLVIFPNEAGPVTLHLTMFLPLMLKQCSDEQKAKWLPLCYNFNIIGTYAQTELGHGTHLRGLETTATYDKLTEEFVIHSPTLTSSKWWPGGLGKSSNHAAVMANLIIDGKSYGMQSFIVQIRSMRDHQPLNGITVGTIGPKFGYESMDNGYLRFNKFRIPRENLLAKFSSVSKEGVFSRIGNNKLLYLTMVETRLGICYDSGTFLGQAATIATRYSMVRKQSEITPGAGEVMIMDHIAQQQRVLPSIAETFALRFASVKLIHHYKDIEKDILNGNEESLSEIHCIASALKSFSTSKSVETIERCRHACGGHGFSDACGIPKLYKHAVPAITYEGDNNVLYIQCGKLLIKNVMNSKRYGRNLTDSLKYLVEVLPPMSKSRDLSLDDLILAFKLQARKSVYHLLHKQLVLRESGISEHDTHNRTSLLLIESASKHAHQYVVETFVKSARAFVNPENRTAMLDLCALYVNSSLIADSSSFLKYSILTPEQVAEAENRQIGLLALTRKRAISLVDALDFSDYALNTVLGRYDGDVYENMYKWAQNDPLNKTQVHESFKDLKELMNYNSKSKL